MEHAQSTVARSNLRKHVLHCVLTKVIGLLKRRRRWTTSGSERETFDAAVDLLVELNLKFKKEDALRPRMVA